VLDLDPDQAVDIIDCDLIVDVLEPIEAERYHVMELQPGPAIEEQLPTEGFKYYCCVVHSPYSVLKLEFACSEGKADVFIAANRRFPSQVNHEWVPSDEPGGVKLFRITQEDPNFVVGTYFIGVYRFPGQFDSSIVYSLKVSEDIVTKGTDESMDVEQFEVDESNISDEQLSDSGRLGLSKSDQAPMLRASTSTLKISTYTHGAGDGGRTLGGIGSEPQILSNDRSTQLRALLPQLQEEPLGSEPETTLCTIRLPSGEVLTRHFSTRSPLQAIKDFVDVHALPEKGGKQLPAKYFFVTDFPRVEWKDMNITLKEANLVGKRCTIRVAEWL